MKGTKPCRARPLWSGVTALLLLAALSASGCTKPAASKPPAFEGTLTVAVAAGLAGYPGPLQPDTTWFQNQARAYESSHPGVKIQLQVAPSPAELEADVRATGASPDLMFGRFLPDLAPRLVDLSSVTDPALLNGPLPTTLEGFRSGAAQLGLPVLLDMQVLALNEAAFKAAGVSLPADGTWSYAQFEDSLKRLSGAGRYALGFYALPGYHEWWPFMGPFITSDGSVASPAVDGLTKLMQWQRNGQLFPDTARLSAEATWSQFAGPSPKIAIMPVGTWAIALLRSPPFQTPVTIAGFPGGSGLGYTYGYSVFAGRDPARLEQVLDLAAFLSAPDRQVELARLTGLVPAHKLAPNPFDGDPSLTRVYQLRATHHPLWGDPTRTEASVAVDRDLVYALLGVRTPADTLADVASHLKEASPLTAR